MYGICHEHACFVRPCLRGGGGCGWVGVNLRGRGHHGCLLPVQALCRVNSSIAGDKKTKDSDWFKDPWAKKWIPHRNKVTAPVMTLSHQGHCIGLSWIQEGNGTRWFNNEISLPQPVFAAPNFVDRMDNSLLGLMLPGMLRWLT
jgi:hypothetical protein